MELNPRATKVGNLNVSSQRSKFARTSHLHEIDNPAPSFDSLDGKGELTLVENSNQIKKFRRSLFLRAAKSQEPANVQTLLPTLEYHNVSKSTEIFIPKINKVAK